MVAGVSMVRDEADIVEETVGRMATQVDRVLVADNGSTDGTREILDRLPVTVIDDPEIAYYQARKMSALAERAREMGAAWVVPFDADEVWLPRQGGSIANALRALPDEALIADAVLFDHVATSQDPAGSPVASMGWRRTSPVPLRKVACRALPGLTIHQGNHSASFDGVDHPLTATGQLEVRHFPYRSVEQMIRKARNGAAAYAATDLPEDVGAHWRGYGKLSDEQIGDVFREFFWSADPAHDGLVLDPYP